MEIIRDHDGDILKFAGDALLVEWQLNTNIQENPYSHPAYRAAVCAEDLVATCSDFVVKTPNSQQQQDAKSSSCALLLNIHCAIGFGDVVGTHVGNRNRMEYVILGDSLRQIAEAMKCTKVGEVVASPETIQALKDIVIFSPTVDIPKSGEKPIKPQVIADRSLMHFRPENIIKASATTNVDKNSDVVKVSSKCQGWTLSMLERFQNRMKPYVHPSIQQDFGSIPSFDQSNSSLTQTRTSISRSGSEEAELRDVVTIFIQPKLPDDVDVMDSNNVPEKTLELLQQIMMVVQAETEHYQGQMRQFIVDDKGLVLILNWGLRGSTFSNMVEERIIPCIQKIQTLLRTELSIDSRIGATSGKVYCGVVGAFSRHEYAVLGPAVNLAARLMANKDNPGILLDRALMRKAGPYHPFRARKPIEAKGYDMPVRIYEPPKSFKKTWLEIDKDQFVGRFDEIHEIVSHASVIFNSRKACSKFVFIEAPYGYGKSWLLSNATRKIEKLVKRRSQRHVTRHVFSEDDSFKPFR